MDSYEMGAGLILLITYGQDFYVQSRAEVVQSGGTEGSDQNNETADTTGWNEFPLEIWREGPSSQRDLELRCCSSTQEPDEEVWVPGLLNTSMSIQKRVLEQTQDI